MSQIYNGLADVGKVSADIGGIIGIIIGIIMMIVGIGFLVQKAGNIPKTTGWIFVGFGAITITVSSLLMYFTGKSKAFSAYEGAGTVAYGVKSLFTGR